jgi:hypothetical protein
VKMPRHIVDHALDRIERGTAHNALLDCTLLREGTAYT